MAALPAPSQWRGMGRGVTMAREPGSLVRLSGRKLGPDGVWAGESSWLGQPCHFLPVLLAPVPKHMLREPTLPIGCAPASSVSSHHVIPVSSRQLGAHCHHFQSITKSHSFSNSPQCHLPSPALAQSYLSWGQVTGSS